MAENHHWRRGKVRIEKKRRFNLSEMKMASIPRLAAGSSAEQVECRDELITDILSRVSTRDLLKMSTVSKRWRTLILDPDFAHTHHKNCHRESIFSLVDSPMISEKDPRTMPERYQFRSYNSQTGNLSIFPFPWEGLDNSVQNENFDLFTASNGLMCFYPRFSMMCLFPWEIPVLWVYNPVRKFSKKLSLPFQVHISWTYFAEICYTQNSLKFVMAGFYLPEKRQYTLVFDFQSNSWSEGSPLLIRLSDHNYPRAQRFFNGVIYFVGSKDAQELTETRDVEASFRDDYDLFHMILGYDVNQDQWGFSIFVPTSVGFIYCLTEWEGNLLVCASNSSYRYTFEERDNLLVCTCNSGHRYDWEDRDWHCDGHFVFWIVDTEHKLWIRERELDLSHQLHTSWKVSASGGVVCFACGYDSIIVYHMKTRHCSTHRLDDAFALRQPNTTSFVSFEPTLFLF